MNCRLPVGQPAYDVAGMVDAVVRRLLAERVRRERLGVLLGAIQVATGHLRTADPQLALRAVLHQLAVLIDDVESERIKRLADGRILLVLVDGVGGCEDGTLRRSIDIIQLEIGGWLYGDEALATDGEMAQRMVVHLCKLAAHLRCHESVCDVVGLKVIVQRNQVEADFLGDDVHGGASRQGGIHVHHASVETVGGVGRHVVAGLQVVVAAVPVTERHEVTVGKHAALRDAGRARGVEEDEETVGLRFGLLLCHSNKLYNVLRQEDRALVFVDEGAEVGVSNEQLRAGILHHEVQTLGRGVDRRSRPSKHRAMRWPSIRSAG